MDFKKNIPEISVSILTIILFGAYVVIPAIHVIFINKNFINIPFSSWCIIMNMSIIVSFIIYCCSWIRLRYYEKLTNRQKNCGIFGIIVIILFELSWLVVGTIMICNVTENIQLAYMLPIILLTYTHVILIYLAIRCLEYPTITPLIRR